MNTGLKRPNKTSLVDISQLLDNYTSALYIKLENEQITGSHKYRLMYGMMTAQLSERPLAGIPGFVEASSGNTGLALAELAQQLNKHAKIITLPTISEKIASKIIKRNGELIYEDDINTCIVEAEYIAEETGFINLNQYDNPNGVLGFREMGQEILDDLDSVTTLVMGVGTGATIAGLSDSMPICRVIACSINDEIRTIPGWKNFKFSKPGQVILNTQKYIKRWELVTIDELVESQHMFAKTLGFLPNLSTTGNLLVAVKEGNRQNDSVIVTVCTGEEK